MAEHHSFEFPTALHSRVLIGDGAMSIQLQSSGLDVDADLPGYEDCNEILNDTRPGIIETIHRCYPEAGIDLMETNTSGCNFPNLVDYDVEDRIQELAHKGTTITRKVVDGMGPDYGGMRRLVLGSLESSTKLPSLGHTPHAQLRGAYTEAELSMISDGADAFSIGTCQDLLQVRAAVDGVRAAMRQTDKKAPIIAHVTVETTGTILMGLEIGIILAAL